MFVPPPSWKIFQHKYKVQTNYIYNKQGKIITSNNGLNWVAIISAYEHNKHILQFWACLPQYHAAGIKNQNNKHHEGLKLGIKHQ